MNFCSTSSTFLQISTLLPPEGRHLMHFMCSQRKGVLCGFCSDGLSVYFHSRDYHCGSESLCSYGLLFYALSELLPVVVIFTIIIFFNISFTSGNVNGLILFSQALDIVTINFKDYQIDQEIFYNLPMHLKIQYYLQHIYEGIYDIFNLDFFRYKQLSYCMFKNAGVMPILAIKYITTLFAFFLVLCLVALLNSNRCVRICQLQRRIQSTVKASYIHGISAFLVLCYAQCTRVTFFILTWANLTGNSKAQPQNIAVTYYGGLQYFGKNHIPYALPALACLCSIVVLSPLLLAFYPLAVQTLGKCGLSEHRIVALFLKFSQVCTNAGLLSSLF